MIIRIKIRKRTIKIGGKCEYTIFRPRKTLNQLGYKKVREIEISNSYQNGFYRYRADISFHMIGKAIDFSVFQCNNTRVSLCNKKLEAYFGSIPDKLYIKILK